MTDRPEHRAAAEGALTDAREWGRQAGELSPEASELSCLAYAAVHALFAIHDTLTALKPEPATYPRPSGPVTMTHPWPPWPSTLPDVAAADRYAANEAKQREAEPDPLALDEAECSRCGTTYPSTAEATMEHHRACTGETPENPMGDPLDEDDHRDRLDGNGLRVRRKSSGYWVWAGAEEVGGWTLDDIHRLQGWPGSFSFTLGPLAFAPDAAQEATGDDLSASEGESGHVEGEGADDAPEALLCPECGHDIDRHAYDDDRAVDLCGECPDTERCPTPLPSQVARPLIEQAVNIERTRLTAQLRLTTSSAQDSGDLAELDALADEWEAGTDG